MGPKDIDHKEILINAINGDNESIVYMLNKIAEGLFEYDKFTVKGVKSSCTKSRTTFQTAKKAIDEIRKKTLEIKKSAEVV